MNVSKERFKKSLMRKAQLQTMETIAVLFVFFILLALAMIFYLGFQKTEFEQSLHEQRRLQAAELAQTVLNLPELQKSRTGTIGLQSLDVYRLEALRTVLAPDSLAGDASIQLTYATKFGRSRIRVRQLYPEEKVWLLYDKGDEGAATVRPFFIPVSLYEPQLPDAPLGTYSFGILEVWYYG